jgi:CRP/FNR family transcriptional regulator
MLIESPALAPAQPACPLGRDDAARTPRPRDDEDFDATGRQIAERLATIAAALPLQRRIVHAGTAIYQAGEHFTHLHVINSGFYKVVNLSRDGREQIVGLKFRGDWLGFDGIAENTHDCDAIALDTGEVWAIPYPTLMQVALAHPRLLATMHEAMSREIARDRHSLMSVCTLPADARVADFLRYWASAVARRGLRTDQITLRMSRAEIGNYLGVTVETVSRSLSRLARTGLIRFADRGRREVRIHSIALLTDFIQASLAPAGLAGSMTQTLQ